MRTIQMTLDDELVEMVDKLAKQQNVSRSAFTRQALRNAIRQISSQQREEQHRQGYMQHPVKKGEFDTWEDEQDWGEN